MFGYRAKLGILYPAPGFVVEPEFFSVLPEGVTVCTTRIPLAQTTPEGLVDMATHACEAGKLLAQARVDVIGFLCTSGSFVEGVGFDRRLASEIRACTGIETVTTSTSVVEAINVVMGKKLVVVTPYSQEINELEQMFLEGNGFEVLGITGLNITDPYLMGQVDPGRIYRLSRDLWTKDADALLISCTGIETFSIIETLERDLEKPVITSNQASLWHMLRIAGVRASIPKLGSLFSTPF
jgi:maleate isomerase